MKNKIKTMMQQFINDSNSPVILGGHFSLMNTPGNKIQLMPAIFQDCLDKQVSDEMRQNPYMAHFPVETFAMSLELLKHNHQAKLLLLSNDWQNVKETAEFTKGELRDCYYQFISQQEIPLSYRSMSDDAGIMIDSKILHPPKGFTYHKSRYWSEQLLRNKFDNSKNYKSCSLKHGCAQEFMPLLDKLEVMGFDKLVAMIPATCAYPVIDAVNEFKNMHNGKIDIMTAFINNSLSLENFWDCSTFVNGKEVDVVNV